MSNLTFLKAALFQKLMRYGVVGIINSAFAYGVYALLIYSGVHYRAAVFITFIVGIFFNFKTIGGIVFRSHDNHLIFRFTISYLFVYLLANAGLEVAHRWEWNMYVTGVLMMPLGAVLSFVLFNVFVFRKKAQAD